MGPGWFDTSGAFPVASLTGTDAEGLWLTGSLAAGSGAF